MKTALITGVSGYLGSHLAKTLKLNGWKIVGLDKRHTTNKYVDLFYPCDVTDINAVYKIFARVGIDTVFHLAGRIEVCESEKEPIEFHLNNVSGTINVLDAMKYHGTKNIVYSSTAGIYRSKDYTLSENAEVNPLNNPYASSKYSAELAIKHSGMNYVIFRYFNLAGADPDGEFGECHEPETHLIPKIFQNLNTFQIYGDDYDTPDGTCIRDYVHVSDVSDAHLLATNLFQGEKVGEIINLGTGRGYSILEILELVKKHTDAKIQFQITNRRGGDPSQLVANINYAKKILKFQPKHDIVSILKTTYAWQKRND